MSQIIKSKPDTKQSLTISLASLASSTTLVAGRESNEIDNTSTRYNDVLVQGRITVGTTPTVSTFIVVTVWGSDTSAATTNLDVLDGVDSAETFNSAGIRDAIVMVGATILVDSTTSDRPYPFKPFSLLDLFGRVPNYWGVWVSHSSVAALNATGGNHVITYEGFWDEIV